MHHKPFFTAAPFMATSLSMAIALGANGSDANSRSEVEYSNAVRCQEQGKYAEAVSGYKRSLKLDPVKSETYYSLGTCFQAMHDSDAALSNFRKAASIKLKPEYTAGINNILQAKAAPLVERGIAEMTLRSSDEQTQLSKAIKDFRSALELYDEPTTHFNLAQALKRAGLAEEAEQEYRKAEPHK